MQGEKSALWNRMEGITGEEVCSPEEKGNSCSISQTSEIIKAEGKL